MDGLVFENNIQLGMVRIFFTSVPDLAPKLGEGASSKSKAVIEVPSAWLGFFQAILQAPGHHKWAKALLESGLPRLLHLDGDTCAPPAISCKPSETDSCGLLGSELMLAKEIEEAIDEDPVEKQSPNKKRGRKPKAATPVVDSAARRSNRVRASSNGFKTDICKVKNCLGCNTPLPTLSLCSLREIGTTLCNLQVNHLEGTVMNKNKLEPVGKKMKKSKEGKDSKKDRNDDKNNDKNEDH